jgi:GDP-D-mannose 3',5'-epimerase
MKRVLVTGAGGFIGHQLVSYLRKKSYWVRGVDLKYPEYEPSAAHDFALLDLRRWEDCLKATDRIDEVYALAADMGGMGFISAHHAEILRNNSLINLHTLDAARENGVKRYLYTSSHVSIPNTGRTTRTSLRSRKKTRIRHNHRTPMAGRS